MHQTPGYRIPNGIVNFVDLAFMAFHWLENNNP